MPPLKKKQTIRAAKEKPAKKKQSSAVKKDREDTAALRRAPMRARGHATFDAVLDATAELIEKIGHEAVNTNNIAEAAGINIASVYQYFSNKQAILIALFERQTAPRVEAANDILKALKTNADWRQVISDAIDRTVKLRRGQKGSVGLRLALRSSPELLVHEHQADAPLIKAMAEALVARAGLSAKKAKLVARLSVEMTTHYLDMWLIEKSMRTSAMIDELKVAVFAYLALYLDKD